MATQHLSVNVEMATSYLNDNNSVLSKLTLSLMPLAACWRQCSGDSAWTGVFARSTRYSVYTTRVIVSIVYCQLLEFFSDSKFFFHFLTFEVRNQVRLKIDIGLIYLLARQYQRSRCPHHVSRLFLSWFWRSSF